MQKSLEIVRRHLIRRSEERMQQLLDAGSSRDKLVLLQKNVTYLKSNDFARKFGRWRPWKLDSKSVEAGKNLHLNAFRNYAGYDFRLWVSNLAKERGVDEQKVWVSVLESLRKAQWVSLKYVIEKQGIGKKWLLPIVVHDYTPAASAAFSTAIIVSRKFKRNMDIGDFNKIMARPGMGEYAVAFELTRVFD